MEKVSYGGDEYVQHIGYNARGQRLLIALGNDMMTRYTYDKQTFRLVRQRTEKFIQTQVGNTITYQPDSNVKQDDGYVYDLIGNILDINLKTTGCCIGGTDSLTRTFTYDPMYRLSTASGRENVPSGTYPFPGWSDTTRSTDPNTTVAYTRNFQYDKVGNIEQMRQTGTHAFTREYDYNTGVNTLNQVTIGTNDYTYSYDAVGNQTIENSDRHFEWDAGNRLLIFKNQVGSSDPTIYSQYLYDAGGNRVKKIVRKGSNYEIRTYIDGVIEYFTDEVNTQNTIHISDNKSRITTIRIGAAMGDSTPAIKYVLENNIGSSMVLIDDSRATVNLQEYYPFGETSFGSYSKKRYQYVGKERDEESGLYYYGARYYAGWIGRFVSVDPLAPSYKSLSPYLNSFNNPISFNDPTGMGGEKGSQEGDTDNVSPQSTQKIVSPEPNEPGSKENPYGKNKFEEDSKKKGSHEQYDEKDGPSGKGKARIHWHEGDKLSRESYKSTTYYDLEKEYSTNGEESDSSSQKKVDIPSGIKKVDIPDKNEQVGPAQPSSSSSENGNDSINEDVSEGISRAGTANSAADAAVDAHSRNKFGASSDKVRDMYVDEGKVHQTGDRKGKVWSKKFRGNQYVSAERIAKTLRDNKFFSFLKGAIDAVDLTLKVINLIWKGVSGKLITEILTDFVLSFTTPIGSFIFDMIDVVTDFKEKISEFAGPFVDDVIRKIIPDYKPGYGLNKLF